ncbi:MAG: hypothetical protein HYR79_06375 [Nitrospirae bacterium]|nr:hypothetical protein [Nitrospirota bacterium]
MEKLLKNRFLVLGLLLSSVFFLLTLPACGGGGSSGGSLTTGVSLSGTAASGKPVINATITVKDKNGTQKTGTTDSTGKYTIDATGLTAPFLLKVDLPNTTSLYSIGGQTGIVNIHPFTDMIVQNWYTVQGKTIAAAFADPVGNPPPTATEIKVIASVVKEVIQSWLVSNNIDPAAFDLISTPFTANSTGFDKILDQTTVASNVITITDMATTSSLTSTVNVNTSTSSVSFNTTTTVGSTTSTSITTAVIPTTSAEQTALNGVSAMFNQFASVVNTKGTALVDTDMIGFYDASYLNEGLNATIGAGRMASDMRGATLNSLIVDKILSYDDINKVVRVYGKASTTQNGVTLASYLNDVGDKRVIGMQFKKQNDGTWRFFGNQKNARADVSTKIETRYEDPAICNTCSGVFKTLDLQVSALVNTVSSATATGPINGTTSTYTLTTYGNPPVSTTYNPTPSSTSTIQEDQYDYFTTSTSLTFPPVGTVYTFAVNFSTSPSASYTIDVPATTGEAISMSGITGHALADAKLGLPLTVNWTLPTTFSVKSVSLYGFIDNGAAGRCQVPNVDFPVTSTTGSITLPTTCNGTTITASATRAPVQLSVRIIGVHGEETTASWAFH